MLTGILGTRIMTALAALFNFLALNLALLVFSLPVITLPAAVSAATLALDRWRRDGEDQVVREFLIGFRDQWARQTVLVGVPLAAAVLGVIEVRHFAGGGGADGRIALGLGTVALVVTASALGYVFLLAARGVEGPEGSVGLADTAGPVGLPDTAASVGLPDTAGPVGLAGTTGTTGVAGVAGTAGSTAAAFWTLCLGLAVRNLLVTGPLFLVVIGGAAVVAWIDPPLLLLGLPLLALQLMRVTADFGLRRLAARRAS
jgi:Protein of unknown function, DUF624